ncbi:MAG: hypothetical protein HY556_07975 [Euryarchaeota archaeon]|nr:hypothetical protein [Euryarchaeota archaeon]
MMPSLRPPKPKFAKTGANPTLATIELVRAILQEAEEPISRNAILEQLARWRHSTTRQSLNAILRFLAEDGSVLEGSKGIIWVPEASPELAEAIRNGRKL